MASVTIEGVEKAYGATKVIHGINVEARDGEFVVLVGPSGCGKSTLLRMIAGLEEISRGRIRIGDRVVNNLSPKDRDIAMVFQNYALYPHMSVRENMEFSLRLQKMPAKEREDRVKRAAGILGIEQLLHRRPGQLSGGQRQRVAMGRAIVRDPKVFLFDEPLSNLDAKLRVQMRGEIRDLHRRLGTTCIYVTHDQIEAMTMADRIVVMRDGVVEQIGSPLELYDRPANTFVGAFLGSPAMNFLPGKVTAEGGPAFVTQSGMRIALPAATGVGDGGEVLCGFRPEAVELGGAQPLRAVVRAVEPTGSETHLFATLDGVDIVAVLRDRISPAIGEEVPISIAPPRVHLFDARTTTRLN